MSKNRLEAFSDGVFAIMITIMILEMKVPHHPDMSALWALWPVFLSYVLSFVFFGIYWENHHHMLQAFRRITGKNLWRNLHLLFWLSRSFLSSPAGWERIILPLCRWRSMAWVAFGSPEFRARSTSWWRRSGCFPTLASSA